MTKFSKIAISVLIILNLMVLMGQLWPAGAPPFAHIVNIAFLLLNIVFLAYLLSKKTAK